ncbi:MAG TPA: NUDIX domain-containing protein [Herpetosiphonaceae bacterium]
MAHIIDKLAWICIEQRRLLGARSQGREVWYLPGGKREPGETDEQCLVREIREELAVELLAPSLRLLSQFEAQADGKAPGVLVRMTCYAGECEGRPAASAEIAELAWLAYADRSRTSAVSQLIFAWLKERDLID